MSIKNFIGWSIIVAFFASMFAFIVHVDSVRSAVYIFGALSALTLVVGLVVCLITSN